MILAMPTRISLADKPTLIGKRVRLRPVRADDAPQVAALHPETLRLTGTRRVPEVEELRRWYGGLAEHDDRLDLAIVEPGDDRYAGEAVLNELDPDSGSCGFRILLIGPQYFGRGLGTEAARLMLAHAFDTVGLHRVELEVYAFNPRARHVYEKVGFVHEGVKRHALRWDGAWVDAHVMAILSDEWATHRGYPDLT
ncbi:GNAT family protein [Rugosimonospora acidiphila]|uniref:GNAT family protein n=1 Tax=Rugosimonospora acidiphila TaxID=556531 RepID=A0ABP9S9W4_9ACTN